MPLTYPMPDLYYGPMLQEALAAAGIVTELTTDEEGRLVLTDTDDAATADPIVAAHPQAIRDRDAKLAADEANRLAIVVAARNALQANRDFLAIGSPTNAQVLAQVRALTRQCNGLIRLALGDLTGTN